MGSHECIERGVLLQRAFDGASIGLAIADAAGRKVEVNDALCAITGHDRDALIGTPRDALIDDDDSPEDGTAGERRFIGRPQRN
jgi:PAS domain S-box-containing protein